MLIPYMAPLSQQMNSVAIVCGVYNIMVAVTFDGSHGHGRQRHL